MSPRRGSGWGRGKILTRQSCGCMIDTAAVAMGYSAIKERLFGSNTTQPLAFFLSACPTVGGFSIDPKIDPRRSMFGPNIVQYSQHNDKIRFSPNSVYVR